jgi:hypothetical protein
MQKHEALKSLAPASEPAGNPEGANGNSVLPSTAAEVAVVETITSKDGRTIRGTIEVYEAWGVMMKRDDGQVVNVAFELMSAEDMEKFRGRYNEITR